MKVTRFIRSMARTIALVVLITVSGVSSAAAALLASDFLTAGDGFITRDDVTGLEWLDLTMTTSLSPNEVLGGALGLLTTHGFRYAVRNEIDTLYLSQGLTIDTGFVVGNEPGAGNLISLMGCTFGCGGNSPGHEGFMEPNSLTPGFAHLQFIQQDIAAGTARVVFGAAFTDFDQSAPSIGHYLIRDTQIPEPVGLAIFGMGLAGLASVFRLHRKLGT